MSLYVDSSQEETFRLVTDYLTRNHIKIVALMPPSYVKAEFGSWSFSELADPKGEVEAKIFERGGGSDVSLIFNFSKEYLRIFMEVLFASALIWTVLLLLSTLRPWGTGISFSEGVVPATLLNIAVVAVELAGYAARIRLKRKNLIKGFNSFACASSRKG